MASTSPRAASMTRLSPTELDTYAQYAWLSGRIGEAIDLYSDLARLYRRSPHVHFKLGYLYLACQDHTSAIKHFTAEIERQAEEAIVEGPSPSPLKATSPGASQTQLQQQRAFTFCTYAGRSEAFQALRETSKADMDLLYITNRGGNTRQNLLAMGCLYFRFGMHQRADECFERCASVDNDDAEYLVSHGELRLAQRRYAVAASMFEKCRLKINASSPIFHRALIGQGSALIQENKLQDAVILLLQAMNALRSTIKSSLSESTATPAAPVSSPSSPSDTAVELVHLYHRATNLYGGLCLMKGELNAALDTYVSVLQPAGAFTDIVPFQLPTICITPGTKNQFGDVLDSGKVSTKNLSETIRHLNEIEWRYGPDPCLYFHRANIHRATGDFDAFIHDLSVVESMDPGFLKKYTQRDWLGDFLDVETISWIPMKLVDTIHDALERNEYRIPSESATAIVGSAVKRANGKPVHTATSTLPKHRSFSESALLVYMQERVKNSKFDDEYAQVVQLDIFRRLPDRKKQTGKCLHATDLATWEGVIFDDIYAEETQKPVEQDHSTHNLAQRVLTAHARHPCAHMFAGMIELEKFNVAQAHKHFGDAVDQVDRKLSVSAPSPRLSGIGGGAGSNAMSSLAQRWHQQMLQKVKYYSLIWRSVTCRVKIEMEKAVEDLNLAAAVRLGDQISGSDDPLLLIQRTLIMLLNGHLKSAYKLLRQLKKSLRLSRRIRPKTCAVASSTTDVMEVIDMFSNAGLNTFHLLPVQVQKECSSIRFGSTDAFNGRDAKDEEEAELEARDRAEDAQEEANEEETAISMVRYALTKKTTPQTELLDKFYESGLLKLSVSGTISQVIPFFQAILSMDESYLPPTNFASLEIFKCKEAEFMEEKLFNCFVRLGKRSKWLEKKIKWKFEALIDSNLAHAYLPSDLETLWHRARMVQDQKNYQAAINDLSECLQLMAPHFEWEKGKIGEKASFNSDTKRTQWLQLQLERGMLYMELHNWAKAIDDLTMVITQAGSKSPLLQASAYEARSACLVSLKRYGHAILDLQQLLALSKGPTAAKKKNSKKNHPAVEDIRRREDKLLNCILVGNLYCKLAVDQMKASSALARKSSVSMNPRIKPQATASHLNMGFITRATEYFDAAEEVMADHFLVHYFRGRMFAISGQSRLATQSLTECLRLHAMFLPALFLRGCIYAQENLFVLALADFYRVRHRIATYPHLHTCIGFCHLERGSLPKAVELFTEAIMQNSDDVDALYMRGCALQELMVLENAMKDFERVTTHSPEHYRAHYQHAVCNILLKKYKAALHETSIVLRLQPEWKEAWILQGYTCFCAEKYDQAVSSYGSAISLPNPPDFGEVDKSRHRDSMLFLYRAIAYIQAGKYQAALNDLDLGIKRDNENYVAFIAKAFCLSQMGDRLRAKQTLAHCLPHYKQLKFIPATQVLESERNKEMLKNESTREASVATTGFNFSSPTSPQESKRPPMITAHPDKLFQRRKQQRDCEPQGHLRSVLTGSSSNQGTRRISSSVNVVSDRRSSVKSPVIGTLTSPSTRKFSTTQSALLSAEETAAYHAHVLAKQQLRAKMLRVFKKLTFQHRVLKALETAANSKYKKSQQMARELTEIMQPTSKVGWPKGTLTTRILMWAFNAQGIYLVKDRKVDDALMAFTLAIQAHPLNGDTNFNRGNVFLHMDVLHSAVSGFQDAIEQDDQCYRAHNNLGVAYYKMERFNEAQDAFSTGLHHAQDTKERALFLYNLGVTFQALGKQEEALDFYQQAISNDGSRTEFFNNRSAILHHQMKYAVALEDYNRALQLQDRRSGQQQDEEEQDENDTEKGFEARLNRAQLHIAMGNCTLASHDLKVVLKDLSALRVRSWADQAAGGDGGGSGGGSSTSHSLSSAGGTSKVDILQEDLHLATELLAFCQKWRTAMRIAVKDFLFALHALPCFSVYEFSPLFGAELVRLQERERERMFAEDYVDTSSEIDKLQIVPLPIQDASFFDYERVFSHWMVTDDDSWDENEFGNQEQQVAVRASVHDQWTRSYADEFRDALQASREGSYEDAARYLLRAHYKTTLDSHDEYLLLTWRIQVTVQQALALEDANNAVGVVKAIAVLRDFLGERKTREESRHDDDDDDLDTNANTKAKAHSRSHRNGQQDDGEDDLEDQIQWKSQRVVIRADLFTLLGSLYQLNGQLAEARSSFQLALRLRSDHVFASLNYLQLSVVLGEYETALDTSLHLLDRFLAFVREKRLESAGGPVVAPSAPAKPVVKGLLQADRSFGMMLPSIVEAFQNSEVEELGSQMLVLLKEYKNMLSAQIQANTRHIFKTQGAIAQIVQKLRSSISKQAREVAASTRNGETDEDPAIRHLKEFIGSLDSCQEKFVQEPADSDEDHDLYRVFQAQFAQLCEEIAKTLPEDGSSMDQEQEITGSDAMVDQDLNPVQSEQTIEEFLAAIDHDRRDSSAAGCVRRPSSGANRRAMSATRGSMVMPAADLVADPNVLVSPRRTSALSYATTSGEPLQPQRPKTGPQSSRRRRDVNPGK